MLIALRDKLIALRKFCKKYVTMESVLNVRKTKVFLQRTTQVIGFTMDEIQVEHF